MEIHTSADFRAAREYIGYTQRETAIALQLDPTTIKRYERPTHPWEARPAAWAWMDQQIVMHDYAVERILSTVDDLETQYGHKPHEIRLVYYHDGDRMPDHKPAGFHNSIARDVAQILKDDEIGVKFEWAAVASDGALY